MGQKLVFLVTSKFDENDAILPIVRAQKNRYTRLKSVHIYFKSFEKNNKLQKKCPHRYIQQEIPEIDIKVQICPTKGDA